MTKPEPPKAYADNALPFLKAKGLLAYVVISGMVRMTFAEKPAK